MFEYDDAEMTALQFMIAEFKSIAHDPDAQRRILRYLNDRFGLGLLLLRPQPPTQPPTQPEPMLPFEPQD